MKLRIADRILVALAGLLLLACCAGIVAQMFFGVDLVGFATRVFSNDATNVRVALIAAAAVLLLLGGYCLFVLFRHRKRKDRFVLQKNESGELAISIKALENMVNKCLDQHDEIQVQRLYLETKKDGVLIRIRGSVCGGISIPLTVEALQKQIRQYVTACSGVEVRGIRVQIESSGEDAVDAPFAIAGPAGKPLLHEAESKQEEPAAEKKSATEESAAPAPAPAAAPAPEAPAAQPVPPEEDDDRPLHQRLFPPQPEPCIVPEPPAEELTGGDPFPAEDASEPIAELAEPAAGIAEPAAEIAESAAEIAEPAAEIAESAVQEAGEIAEGAAEDLSGEKAGDDFLESLKAFDDMMTGEK